MAPVLLALLLAGPLPATAEPLAPAVAIQSAPRDIGVGDPLRRPLLDALRPAIEDDLGQPVQFMVDRLRVQGDWAFFAGSVQRPDGRPIDFSRTRYAEAVEEGFFDGPGTYGLLRRVGGRWRAEGFFVGPTDAAYLSWPDEQGAPASLFE
ncbi:hypothetical protein [Brevundimonas aurifodinae]|uniref:Uncharacterized protein n=2 Tax=Brevundimonas TaxID=41275 RepID=A0ABV1NS85_9CAUL|nr:MAG: hypothetical protein B7Z42_14060 [Brevundimonas sp. 12-68-7]OYX30751.1 MAG: hypothetical protein B7Z01_13645 [Brevundimonas subvibrioides]